MKLPPTNNGMDNDNDNDKDDLDEYLRGDSQVSRRYRSTATEEPSAQLDRAVLAQARAAVSSPSTQVVSFPGRKMTRWALPFAVAATIVLTFTVVHETGMNWSFVSAPAEEAEAPAAPSAIGEAENVLIDPVPLPQATNIPKAKQKALLRSYDVGSVGAMSKSSDLLQEAPSAAPPSEPTVSSVTAAGSAPPLPVTAPAPAIATTSAPTADAAPPAVSGRAAVSNAMRSDVSEIMVTRERKKEQGSEKFRSPQEWLENIRKLRAQAKQVEAETELNRFLEVHPDYFEKNPEVPRP